MSLQSQLADFKRAWEKRVCSDTIQCVSGSLERLSNSDLLKNAPKAGDRFPVLNNLKAGDGASFDIAAYLARRPTAIVFYRGGWCPYCNITLRAYEAKHKAFREAGAQLLGISLELPEFSDQTAEMNDLTFPLVTDGGGKLATALGILFPLPDDIRPFYEKGRILLPTRHGDERWVLPVTCTLVVAPDGIIRTAFMDPDYRKRVEPQDVVETLRTTSNQQSAALAESL